MGSEPDDDAMLAGYAAALADAVEEALPAWVTRLLVTRAPQLRGEGPAAAAEVGELAMGRLRDLLGTDIDHQRATPLQVLRAATAPVTTRLAAAGVPPPIRDEMAVRMDPDDTYDLGPAAFADLGEEVATAGLTWGAAKAHVHLARRREIDARR